MTFLEALLFSTYAGTLLGALLVIMLVNRLSREERNPGSTLAWILIIVFLPIVGIPLYLLFGGRKLASMARRKHGLHFGPQKGTAREIAEELRIPSLLVSEYIPAPSSGNEVAYIDDGERAYWTLKTWIEEAKESICICTFILAKDEVAESIIALLAARAREGIKVRLLVDALGSFSTKGSFLDPLREAGGQVAAFMPVLPLYRKWSANLRLHRKIVVVDGNRAIIGGMNIGKEYMGPEAYEKRWKDLVMTIRGPAVEPLLETFAADWEFASGEPAGVAATLLRPDAELPGETPVQIVASGPDVPDDPLHDVLLFAIAGARERIWFSTPYLVLDNTLLRVLKLKCKVGIDVRIMLPANSDFFLADVSRRYSMRILHKAGALIYLHPEMVHSKFMIVDGHMCSVGSANMDMRSLYFNYEISALMYERDSVEHLAGVFGELKKDAVPYGRTHKKVRGWFTERFENIVRLIAPLL